MASDSSFDVVSKIDRQEVDNALNQAAKELRQRFDFRGTDASVVWAGDYGIELQASTEDRVVAALDVLKDKLVRRGVSLKALDAGDPRASGKVYKIAATLQNGLSSEQAKKVAALVRTDAPRSVKATVQGDEVRVASKSKNDLQSTIALLKGEDFDFPVQFVNYR